MSNFNQFFPGQSGYPFFLPTLFGSGADGSLVTAGGGAGDQADIGYLGSFGVKQYTNLTIAAGDTWTVAKGSSNGAGIISVSGTFTLAGSIVADGGVGGNGVSGGSGAGGSTAGGGTGGASVTASGNGNTGNDATNAGHGAATYDLTAVANDGIGRGGASGGYETANAANATGANIALPAFGTSSTIVRGINSPENRLILPSKLIRTRISNLRAPTGTASANGTTQPVYPTINDYGPWSVIAGTGFLDLDYIPPGQGGFGGGVTGVAVTNTAGGGGGGGGGVTIIECANLVLTGGYAFHATGGAGGNGFSAGLGVACGGSGGMGGIIVVIYRSITGNPASITAAGGAAGTGAGTANVNGLAGKTGGVYLMQV